MSTMQATHGHSEACCNIPPIVVSGYKAKGSYEKIGDYNTYVTGPEDATKAIVVIFDIFGFFDQTVQGADILSTSDDHHKYKVFMPDWFHGEPCPIEVYPPDTEDKQKKLGAFFGKYPPPAAAAALPGYVDAVKAKYSSLTKFGSLGMCWGGKVLALTTKESSNPFTVAGSVHPGGVDEADAKAITVPFIMLASKDEPVDDVKKFEAALTGPKHVEIFDDQIHGWMGARADLAVERNKQEYERGYKAILTFFGKHM